jgi:RHS repeat-associated protein
MDNQQRVALIRRGSPFPDDNSPGLQYHLSDHIGSSTAVLDGSAAVISREEYSPYGDTLVGSFARKRFRFAGKERDDESGLYRIGARYYAPWLTRWTSPDPLFVKGAAASEALNLYLYARNNPLKFIDPTGGFAIIVVAVVVVVVGLYALSKMGDTSKSAAYQRKQESGAYGDDSVQEYQEYRAAVAGDASRFEAMAATGEAMMMGLPGPGGGESEMTSSVRTIEREAGSGSAVERSAIRGSSPIERAAPEAAAIEHAASGGTAVDRAAARAPETHNDAFFPGLSKGEVDTAVEQSTSNSAFKLPAQEPRTAQGLAEVEPKADATKSIQFSDNMSFSAIKDAPPVAKGKVAVRSHGPNPKAPAGSHSQTNPTTQINTTNKKGPKYYRDADGNWINLKNKATTEAQKDAVHLRHQGTGTR